MIGSDGLAYVDLRDDGNACEVELSVVAPCFNEADGLPEFYRRTAAACEALHLESYEIVLVNDGSRDATWSVMNDLAKRHREVVAVNLSRNCGHQLALTAGLTVCRGKRILIIDADLQDPPELLAEMMRLADDGADVVYGQRRHRAGETWFKRNSASLFYRLLQKLVDVPIPRDTGDFRLMTRRALRVLNSMPEQHRFIRGMVSWIGLRQVPLVYDRHARFAGTTNYPLGKMIRFAIDAVTSFSTRPLRLASYLGVGFGIFGVLLLLYTLAGVMLGYAIVGWASVMSAVVVLGSIQLIMLGIFGEYFGRLYLEVKQRPLFVIESVVSSPVSLERTRGDRVDHLSSR